MKIKLEGLTQEELDKKIEALVEKTREQTKLNYSEAAERHQKKFNALQTERDNYKELLGETKENLAKIQKERDQFELSFNESAKQLDNHNLTKILKEKNINPKFNDLVIKNYELHSKLDAKVLDQKIKDISENYPEFMVNEKKPPKSPEEKVDTKTQFIFDKNKTYFN